MGFRTADARRTAPIAIVLAAATVAVYWQCRTFEFLNWDDNVHVSSNPQVAQGLGGESVWWALTTIESSNWHPVTRLSWLLDASVFGLDAGAFHATNVVLHAANVLLLFATLALYTKRTTRSAVVAALFALHPLNVESVAWVSERKGLLCAAFWWLALIAYHAWLRERASRLRYAALVAAFALALMSKPVAVTLPFVLLLLDVWPLGRWQRDAVWPLVREKLPLFAIAAVGSAITYVAQERGGAVRGLEAAPLGARLANAAIAYGEYLRKLAWPSDLSPLYPFDPSVEAGKVAAALALLAVLTFAALRSARRFPYLAVGWLWFLGVLVPAIGIVRVGEQSMADRYTYLPMVGIGIAAVWLIGDLLARDGTPAAARRLAFAAAVVVLALLGRASWIHARHWRDSISLFDRVIATAPDVESSKGLSLAYNNRGLTFTQSGRHYEARRDLDDAVRLDPSNAPARNNLGNELARARMLPEAEQQYRAAVAVDPNYAEAHTNLGNVLCMQGRVDEGIESYRAALDIDPQNKNALYNLGSALMLRGDLEGAVRQFEAVLRVNPSDAASRARLEQLRAALQQSR